MHRESMQLMTEALDLLRPFLGPGALVLDVGSYDVNGSFRDLVLGRGYAYTGLDIQSGPNVDIVAADAYRYPIPDDCFDLVISGSTMEHVQAIWAWVRELARVVRPGGYVVIITHWQFPVHNYPVDCWRILPDGMNYLFGLYGLTPVDVRIANATDTFAIARKDEAADMP